MKWPVHLIFAILYFLVLFFGVGPILLADGTIEERIITSIVVLAIFVVLIAIHLFITKKMKKK